MTPLPFRGWYLCSILTFFLLQATGMRGETCQASGEMDDATRAALNAAGQRYFDMVARGDSATLRQNAIPSLASDFSGIEATVKEHQLVLAGSKAAPRPTFLLDASGTDAIPHAEFYCGVFGKNGQTAGSAVFSLSNLPAGKYGVVILDATGTKTPTTVSLILQELGSDWKIAGLYIKSLQFAGHEGDWFVTRARECKAKGQLHNAWLYYQAAVGLVSPLDFMSTAASDKLLDESQGVKPADFPLEGKTVDLAAGTATYKLTALFPQAVGDDVDLIVKYQASDISNTKQTYQNNVDVMKALAAKYPEVKEAFAAMVARAVDSSGRDYGTLLAMKDIK